MSDEKIKSPQLLEEEKNTLDVLDREQIKKSKDIFKYSKNRELSWLNFNKRVLEEALDPATPAFESLKFIGIFTSNLE